jgi:hypothetical protein
MDLHTLPLVAGSPRLGPCIGSVGKFLCIGLTTPITPPNQAWQSPPNRYFS